MKPPKAGSTLLFSDNVGNSNVTISYASWGGRVILNSFQDLEQKFVNKEIHPQDLKIAVTKALDKLLSPVRKHFQEDTHANELFERVKSYQVTR